jgi:hypothetical protein
MYSGLVIVLCFHLQEMDSLEQELVCNKDKHMLTYADLYLLFIVQK